MAIKPIYEFEEPLLNISAKIYPSGKKFRIESDSFSYFHRMKLKYSSLEEAKQQLGKAVLTRYCRECITHETKVRELNEVIKTGQARMDKRSSLDSWLEKLNHSNWDGKFESS